MAPAPPLQTRLYVSLSYCVCRDSWERKEWPEVSEAHYYRAILWGGSDEPHEEVLGWGSCWQARLLLSQGHHQTAQQVSQLWKFNSILFPLFFARNMPIWWIWDTQAFLYISTLKDNVWPRNLKFPYVLHMLQSYGNLSGNLVLPSGLLRLTYGIPLLISWCVGNGYM